MVIKALLKMAVACAALTVVTEVPASELVKLRVGWVVTPYEFVPILFEPPGVAQHVGKSYSFEPVHFGSSSPMITALASGDLDITPLTFFTLAAAITNAKLDDLRIIADEYQDGARGYFSGPFVVANDSPIKTISDLKGKVVASFGIGSSGDIVIRTMLRKQGLEEKRDYNDIEGAPQNLMPMLLQGKVDLINLSGITAHDPAVLEKTRTLFTQKDALGATEVGVFVARAPFLSKNRAAVVDFLEDMLRSMRWYADRANHAEAVRIVSQFTKQPTENFDNWLFTKEDMYRDPNGLVDADGLQRPIDAARSLGFLKGEVGVEKYLELGPVKEAAARLK
jgi:sulfonate transport system substrate-binding protein